MHSEELLYSIRRWLIGITFLLSVILFYQTSGPDIPAGVDATVDLVAFVVGLVSLLWLWHSYRGASGPDSGTADAAGTAETDGSLTEN